MSKKQVSTAIINGGAGTRRSTTDAARDVDWPKVRRVQLGLVRSFGATTCGPGHREERRSTRAGGRRATALAHALASLAGFLTGLAILRGLSEEPVLLAAAFLAALAGTFAAHAAVS
ncbi:MAG: hypothetical protein KatS3mg108_2562 [Isosphaeraceae bacterium]|jgi:hypothetical protein|nr:MAG: hypothetical protein KatS3mg108_2562 [Isosphaeraceae bacterium]